MTNQATDALASFHAQQQAFAAALPKIRTEGEAALRRLFPVAQGDTGQSGVVARFLLGLYNGRRFPFDLTELRRLDAELLDDCLAVLRMDATPLQEVHEYFPNGGRIFEGWAATWCPTPEKS